MIKILKIKKELILNISVCLSNFLGKFVYINV